MRKLERARPTFVVPVLAVSVLTACGDGGGSTAPVAPVTPAPAPSQLTVAFAESPLSVAEGETAEIAIRYRTEGLATPVSLGVSVLPGTAEAEDFEISPDAVEIPAGTTPDGRGSLTLRALADRLFAEGDETLEVRFVTPPGVRADVTSGLELTIEDAGTAPCAGTTVRGRPPQVEYESARTTFFLEFATGSRGVVFDWFGPYDGDDTPVDFAGREMGRTSHLQVIVLDWTTERSGRMVRHRFDFEWPGGRHPGLEAGIRFRSDDGACTGEPAAICTETGCELIP